MRAKEGLEVNQKQEKCQGAEAKEFKNINQKLKFFQFPNLQAIMRMTKKIQKNFRSHMSKGVTDRRVPDEKPKHLFSGKRGVGKTDRR